MSEQYDVIVIGAGPAGYPAAIRAGQNKLKVACIDGWKNYDGSYAFGGTCLNAGCIPSKALLESSELYHRAQHEFELHGIKLKGVEFDVAAMQSRKSKIVKSSTQGIAALLKGAGVNALVGHGKLLKAEGGVNKVEYTDKEGKVQVLSATHVVLASGSVPTELKSLPFDGKDIIDSWGALELSAVPKRLGVIGAGVIGLELGSVWNRLGAQVTVLEALDSFLPMADQAVSAEALKNFKKQGLDVKLGAKVSAATKGKDGVTLKYTDASGEQSLVVDKVVVAIGRRPFTTNLLAEGSGVELDERGFVKVDHECRTGMANVWAVGDLVRGPMLAHKGKEEGVVVADLIAGKHAEVNYNIIPSVIYTAPEIAWVGQTEQQVKQSGRAYKVGSFPFMASGRARAMEAAVGFCKMISAVDTDEVLGVHIIGPMAGELIGEAVLAMEYSASTEDFQRTIHAHPTLSEAVHEAALAADKIAIDFPNR